MQAAESLKAEATARALEERARAYRKRVDPFSPVFKPDEKVVFGDEAEKIADKPHLTGNSEWDAVELAETDPMREPFDNEFLGRFLKGSGGHREA